jgi:hypothetical protein
MSTQKNTNSNYHKAIARKIDIQKEINLLESKMKINKSEENIKDKTEKRNSTLKKIKNTQDELIKLRLKKIKGFLRSYYKDQSNKDTNNKLSKNLINLKKTSNVLAKEIEIASLEKASKNQKNTEIRKKHNKAKEPPKSIFSYLGF